MATAVSSAEDSIRNMRSCGIGLFVLTNPLQALYRNVFVASIVLTAFGAPYQVETKLILGESHIRQFWGFVLFKVHKSCSCIEIKVAHLRRRLGEFSIPPGSIAHTVTHCGMKLP